MLRKKIALLSNVKELDKLARVYVLEGVLGVPPGTLAKKARRVLPSLSDRLPDADPVWFDSKESNLIRASIKGLSSYTKGLPKNEEDILMEYLTRPFKKGNKKGKTRLYYIGETNKDKIKSGDMSPLKAGRIFGLFLRRKALSQRDELKRRGENIVPKNHQENVLQEEERAKAKAHTIDLRNDNTITNILISVLSDPKNPASNKLFNTINGIIDNYPFEQIHEDPDFSSTAISFMRSFARKNPRMETEDFKSEMMAYLADNPTKKNQKIFSELESTDSKIISEIATQASAKGREDLQREAYKLFIEFATRKFPPLENLSHYVQDLKKDPEAFWNKRLQKVNRMVGSSLGFKPNDATMTRLLGVGGRNVMYFIQEVLAKDPKIKKVLENISTELSGEWGYSRKMASRKLSNLILKVARENSIFKSKIKKWI